MLEHGWQFHMHACCVRSRVPLKVAELTANALHQMVTPARLGTRAGEEADGEWATVTRIATHLAYKTLLVNREWASHQNSSSVESQYQSSTSQSIFRTSRFK